MARKRINAPIYTRGRYGRGWWDTVDTDNDYLYSWCRYPTKITEADLPEDYIKIRSRVTRYMTGYLKTSGIVDMAYRPVKFNHMFKDDYLYISYEEPLRLEKNGLGFEDCVNYDICLCGNDIVDVVLAAERHSGFDTSKVRAEIEKKRVWLRDNHPWDYERIVGEDRDIFEIEAEGRATPEQVAGQANFAAVFRLKAGFMEQEETPAKRGPILYDLSNAKDDFPWTRYFGDSELGHMDFVPKGWGDILHEGLLEMDAILCESDVAERICIAQVKEKFGTLRFYIEKTWPDLDECDDMLEARVDKAMRKLGRVIERMTEETAKVCVICGTREDVRLRRGWVHYSCSECEGQR